MVADRRCGPWTGCGPAGLLRRHARHRTDPTTAPIDTGVGLVAASDLPGQHMTAANPQDSSNSGGGDQRPVAGTDAPSTRGIWRAAARRDSGAPLGPGLGQPRGPAYRRNRRVWDERPETSPRLHRNPRRIRPGPYRSASRSARILSMVTAGAQTPLEKIFRPFFSCTIQCWQAALTLRVKAASPGWKQNPTLRCRQYLAIG